ncbi:MAG: hypothetical protein R6V60_02000 [Desulfobacterales bacterium]
MSVAEKIKDIGREITTDPGVIGGVVQIFAALSRIIISNLTRRPELEPAPQRQELQRR